MSFERRNASPSENFNDFNIGQLLYRLSFSKKKIVRDMEKVNKKLIQNKYDILFNETCIKEELLPNYTNLRLHDPVAKEQQFTVDYRRDLLKFQLRQCQENTATIESELEQLNISFAENIEDANLRTAMSKKLQNIYNNFEQAPKNA